MGTRSVASAEDFFTLIGEFERAGGGIGEPTSDPSWAVEKPDWTIEDFNKHFGGSFQIPPQHAKIPLPGTSRPQPEQTKITLPDNPLPRHARIGTTREDETEPISRRQFKRLRKKQRDEEARLAQGNTGNGFVVKKRPRDARAKRKASDISPDDSRTPWTKKPKDDISDLPTMTTSKSKFTSGRNLERGPRTSQANTGFKDQFMNDFSMLPAMQREPAGVQAMAAGYIQSLLAQAGAEYVNRRAPSRNVPASDEHRGRSERPEYHGNRDRQGQSLVPPRLPQPSQSRGPRLQHQGSYSETYGGPRGRDASADAGRQVNYTHIPPRSTFSPRGRGRGRGGSSQSGPPSTTFLGTPRRRRQDGPPADREGYLHEGQQLLRSPRDVIGFRE